MRIKKSIENISYNDTKQFFNNRVSKYDDDNPYSVTMYQDKHPDLVSARNKAEMEKLLPKLKLNNYSKVLDIACGIGRWSDAIQCDIQEYCGIDFCDGLISLAIDRNKNLRNRFFYVSSMQDIEKTLIENNKGKYNCLILVGSLMYLNDEDVKKLFEAINRISYNNSLICIREPIGIEERLTLKEQFSEELEDSYNAIYRTRDELYYLFKDALLDNGFEVKEENFLFDSKELNNRKETSQYYFILERK